MLRGGRVLCGRRFWCRSRRLILLCRSKSRNKQQNQKGKPFS